MSEYFTHVVKIECIEKHSNADTLDIIRVYGTKEDPFSGYSCIVKNGLWKEGDLGCYIAVDALVPLDHSEFSWLVGKHEKTVEGKKYALIKASKLRGIFSQGIFVPVPEGFKEGDDISEHFGIKKWEPEEHSSPSRPGGSIKSGQMAPDPGYMQHYDIEGFKKYGSLIEEGEEVILTEKIHGCQARYVFMNDQLYVASKRFYKKAEDQENDAWWQAALKYDLPNKMKQIPGIALIGEMYGQVQDLKYGKDSQELIFFDAFHTGAKRYLDYDDFVALCQKLDLPTVPVLYRGPWKPELKELAEGMSTVPGANCIKEGWVLKLPKERWNAKVGRVFLKLVGTMYHLRK